MYATINLLRKQNDTQFLFAVLYYSCELINLCSLHILCRYISCVETTRTDANCKPAWVRLHDTDTLYGTPQPRASTLEKCQRACKFDPHCVDIYFWDNKKDKTLCYIHVHTVRSLSLSQNYSHSPKVAHYALLASRCNISSGQFFFTR